MFCACWCWVNTLYMSGCGPTPRLSGLLTGLVLDTKTILLCSSLKHPQIAYCACTKYSSYYVMLLNTTEVLLELETTCGVNDFCSNHPHPLMKTRVAAGDEGFSWLCAQAKLSKSHLMRSFYCFIAIFCVNSIHPQCLYCTASCYSLLLRCSTNKVYFCRWNKMYGPVYINMQIL